MPKTEDELRAQACQMIAKGHPVARSVALLQLIRDVVATDVARARESVQPAKPPTAVPRTHEYDPSKIQLDIGASSRNRSAEYIDVMFQAARHLTVVSVADWDPLGCIGRYSLWRDTDGATWALVVGSRGLIVRAAPGQPVAAPTTLARPAKPPTADPPPAPNPTRPHTRKDG